MEDARIILIEDEEDIAELIRYNLETHGHSVIWHAVGESGLTAIVRDKPDLVLLDLMLPGIDGLNICRKIKENDLTANIPVVMVTAKGDERDIVCGLEMGADDYITKPFSPKVLIARVNAVLRRSKHVTASEGDILEIHDILIHSGRHEARAGGQTLDLTPSEFEILHFLARRPGWVFTRSQIVDIVHGENYAVTERSVDVQVAGLRKKLKQFDHYIETVRGVGYRFKDTI